MVDLGHIRRRWPQQGGVQWVVSGLPAMGPERSAENVRRIREVTDLGCGLRRSAMVRLFGAPAAAGAVKLLTRDEIWISLWTCVSSYFGLVIASE